MELRPSYSKVKEFRSHKLIEEYNYRKQIPINPFLFYLKIVISFIPGILITHDCSIYDPINKDLSYILSKILFINKVNLNNVGKYDYYCCYLYILLVIILIFGLWIHFLILKVTKRDLELKFRNNKLVSRVPKYIKKVIQILFFCSTIVIIFSNFIIEIFYYGLFKIYYQLENQSHFKEETWNNITSLSGKHKINKYIILVLNVISIIFLNIMTYCFLNIVVWRGFTGSKGYKFRRSKLTFFYLAFICNIQGLYSVSFFYSEEYTKKYKFLLNVLFAVFSFLYVFYTYFVRRFANGKGDYLMMILIWICIISGLIEVLMYVFENPQIRQKDVYYKFVFELMNSIGITFLLENCTRKRIVRSIFQQDIEGSTLHVHKQLVNLRYLFKLLTEPAKNDLILVQLLFTFENHLSICNNKLCICHDLQEDEKKQLEEKEPSLSLTFIAEKILLSLIKASEKSLELQRTRLESLYIMHICFEKDIAKNNTKALYLTQYYFQTKSNKISFDTLYMIFELRKLIAHQFYSKFISRDNFLKRLEIESYKDNFKKVREICMEEMIHLKIQKLIYTYCEELSQIINYKDIFNSSLKSRLDGNAVINTLIKALKSSQAIDNLIFEYFYWSTTKSIEMKYIATLFCNIFKKDENYYKELNCILTDPCSIGLSALSNKKKSSYLVVGLGKDEKFYIKSISLRLLDCLGYTKQEINNMNLQALIPLQCEYHHNNIIKTFMINSNPGVCSSRKTVLLNKKKELVMIKVKALIYPSFDNPLFLICEVKVVEPFSQESDFKKYIILLDQSFNYLSFSVGFDKLFHLTATLLRKIKFSFFSLFGLNQQKVISYFFMKDLEMCKTIKTYNKTKTGIYKTKVEVIPKRRLINSYKKILEILKDNYLETGLQNKFQCIIDNQLNLEKGNDEDKICLKIQEKFIETTIYYFIKIKVKVNFCLYTSPNANTISDKDNHSQRSLSVYKKESKLKVRTSSKLVVPFYEMTKPPKITASITQNDATAMNTTLQNTSSQVMLTKRLPTNINIQQISKQKVKREQEDSNKEILINVDLEYKKSLKQVFFFRIFEIIGYILLFALNIISFTYSKSTLDNSLELFRVNSYGFLMSFDIFSTAINCLRGCFIINGMQEGNYEEYFETKKFTEKSLLTHYHQFDQSIHKMVTDKKFIDVFIHLNQHEEYLYLMDDWKPRNMVSTLFDEIKYISYSLSHFNLNESLSCRLQFFIEGKEKIKPEEETESPTFEEKFIYYINQNIMIKLSNHLDELTRITDKILKNHLKDAKIFSLVINISLIIITLFLFIIVIFSIRIHQKIFKIYYQDLLTRKESDSLFVKDLENFKQLIGNFSYAACSTYEKQYIKERNLLNKQISDMQNMKQRRKGVGNYQIWINHSLQDEISEKTDKIKQEEKKQDPESKELQEKTKSKLFKNVISLPKVTQYSFIFVIVLFILLSTVEFTNFFRNLLYFSSIIQENQISISFFERTAKLGELFLYSVISVMINSPFYITKTLEDYETAIISSQYNIEYNINQDSVSEGLIASNFYYLYYQLQIYLQNTRMYLTDKSLTNKLKETTKAEKAFHQNSRDFCFYVGKYYYEHYTQLEDVVITEPPFQLLNKFVKHCRLSGKGINSSGLKNTLDSHLLQLTTLYKDYLHSQQTKVNIQNFIGNQNIIFFDDNLQSTLKFVHIIINHLVCEDIHARVQEKYKIDILFSVVSLLCFFGLFLFIILIIIGKFEKYTIIVRKTTNKLNYILNTYVIVKFD